MKNKLTSKQIERRGIYNFIFAFVVVIILFSCVSCASRKVDRKEQKQKIDFTEQVTEEVKTNTETTTKVIDSSTIDEIEIVPIDSTKPVVINGKTYLNAKIKHVSRKNNVTTDKVDKVAKNHHKKAKRELKVESSNKEKQTEKTFNYNLLWWLLFLLIPIAYLKYKKYI